MSRLERFIRRLRAQRACLDAAESLVRDLEGPVLEFGLGNGRTYDHLRQLFPIARSSCSSVSRGPSQLHARRAPSDHRRSRDTLPRAGDAIPTGAALVHSDLGSADSDCGPRLSVWLAGVLPLLVRPDGLVASDRELASAALLPLPLPPPAEPGDYFFYRRAA
jgi:hypothetical protein